MARWSCGVCGYVHDGDGPPDKCPNCGSPKERFAELKEGGEIIHMKASEKMDDGDKVKVNPFFGSYEGIQPYIYNLPAGQRVKLHKHPTTDECFYIIKGRFKFKVGDTELVAEPGDVVQGRMDIPHTFQNISDEPGAFLSVKGPKPIDRVMLEE
jgi:mannose-6-phosphate isomerase-like protein (cupin superfamily)